jgi:hypothetical protein
MIGTTIVLSTIAGTINISGLPGNTCDGGFNWLSFATGVTGIVSATLISIHKLFGIAELSLNHLRYTGEYTKLQTDIQVQRAIDNTEDEIYTNLAEYIKELRNKLGRLIDDSPFVPQFIINKNNLIDTNVPTVEVVHNEKVERETATEAASISKNCALNCFPMTIVHHNKGDQDNETIKVLGTKENVHNTSETEIKKHRQSQEFTL